MTSWSVLDCSPLRARDATARIVCATLLPCGNVDPSMQLQLAGTGTICYVMLWTEPRTHVGGIAYGRETHGRRCRS